MTGGSANTISRKRWWLLPAIVIFTFLTAILISYSSPFRALELNVTDQLFELRGPIAVQDTQIVIVSISQQADEEIPYKYPWPTDLYAKLVENLNKAGARAIGIDIIFDKRDRYSPRNDSLFARALQKYGNVVLAGNYEVVRQYRGQGSRSVSRSLIEPLPLLKQANPNPPGMVRLIPDADESIRQYLLQLDFFDRTYHSFGLELLRVYHGWEEPEFDRSDDYFRYGNYRIPLAGPNTMAVNYFNGPRSFSYYSFETVIDDSTVLLASEEADFQFNSFTAPGYGLLESGVFKDKIVLVGATIPSLHDYHSTPFAKGGIMPGVEIHANALQTILTGRYITPADQWVNLLILLFFSILVVTSTYYLGAWWGFAFFILQSLFISGLTLFEFFQFRYIIEYTGPMVATMAGYLSTLSYRYVTEQQEKRRIREMFSSYVSPALVDEMIESGRDPQLGGDEAYLTAFFSDIQSFSTFSEQLEPSRLVELMNEYLSSMTDIINEEGGTLDKYIGDAIVAFFGAPLPQADHAYRACITSRLMLHELEKLREKWEREGEKWPDIVRHMRTRIGINTGKMVTGNMGSSRRFNYTVMGDNVNLAARCETASRKYGIYTMVTGETRREAEKHGDRCVFRYLDRIVVKGRTHPVDVYEVVGLTDWMDQDTYRCIELFEAGTQAYLDRDWNTAIELFEQSAELEPNRPGEDPMIETNPSLVYIERCRKMLQHPPGRDWDGVYVFESK